MPIHAAASICRSYHGQYLPEPGDYTRYVVNPFSPTADDGCS